MTDQIEKPSAQEAQAAAQPTMTIPFDMASAIHSALGEMPAKATGGLYLSLGMMMQQQAPRR